MKYVRRALFGNLLPIGLLILISPFHQPTIVSSAYVVNLERNCGRHMVSDLQNAKLQIANSHGRVIDNGAC